jgi:hypothetical protein
MKSPSDKKTSLKKGAAISIEIAKIIKKYKKSAVFP